jgi:toxin ParE1/3/4
MKTFEVKFCDEALCDIENLYNYIADELTNPIAAYETMHKVLKACAKLDIFPERGVKRQFLGENYRILPVDRQFTIIYSIIEPNVIIKRIFYGKRDF